MWNGQWTTRNTLGNVVYPNGDLVAWITRKQPVVVIYSIEAEYIAVSAACKDGLNMIHFLNKFALVSSPTHIFMDNEEAMYMANKLVTNETSKHIDLVHHLILDYDNEGEPSFSTSAPNTMMLTE